MGFQFKPSMWFICKLCKEPFSDAEKLKEHKLENHLGDCLKIKCIVFEERLLEHDWIPPSTSVSCSIPYKATNSKPASNQSQESKYLEVKINDVKKSAHKTSGQFLNPIVSLTPLPASFIVPSPTCPNEDTITSAEETKPSYTVHDVKKDPEENVASTSMRTEQNERTRTKTYKVFSDIKRPLHMHIRQYPPKRKLNENEASSSSSLSPSFSLSTPNKSDELKSKILKTQVQSKNKDESLLTVESNLDQFRKTDATTTVVLRKPKPKRYQIQEQQSSPSTSIEAASTKPSFLFQALTATSKTTSAYTSKPEKTFSSAKKLPKLVPRPNLISNLKPEAKTSIGEPGMVNLDLLYPEQAVTVPEFFEEDVQAYGENQDQDQGHDQDQDPLGNLNGLDSQDEVEFPTPIILQSFSIQKQPEIQIQSQKQRQIQKQKQNQILIRKQNLIHKQKQNHQMLIRKQSQFQRHIQNRNQIHKQTQNTKAVSNQAQIQNQSQNHFQNEIQIHIQNRIKHLIQNQIQTNDQNQMELEADQNHFRNQNPIQFEVSSSTADSLQAPQSYLQTFEESPNPNAKPKPFMCELCFSFFQSNWKLAQHMKSHSNDRPFQCPHCPTSYKYNESLKRHLIVHGRETAFKCRFCGKSFSARKFLEDHERTHTGEKPFLCPIQLCESAFSSNCALTMHVRIKHSEELGLQQYVCPSCGKCFGLQSRLNYHIRIHHSKAKPFKCTEAGCSAAFKFNKYLAAHVRKVHLNFSILETVDEDDGVIVLD